MPLLLVLLATAAIAFEGYQVVRTLQQSARDGTRAQGDATVREISGFISREQQRLTAFASEKQSAIRQILAMPENWPVVDEVQQSLKHLFPGAIAFSVTGADGRPLFEDFDGLVGPVCQASMRDYAEALSSGASAIPIPPIHPVPGAYHFDLITPWSLPDGESGLFFVSMAPTRIVELLAAAQSATGHRMLLVNLDDPSLIEVSAVGSRDALRGDFRLPPASLDDYHFARDLPGTHWRLVVIPDREALGASIRQVLLVTGLLIGGLLATSALLMVMVRRNEQRKSNLFMNSLQSSVARQRAILQSMVDGLVTIDGRGRIHNVNTAITSLFGYEPREVVGQNVAMLMPEPMQGEHDNYVGKYLATGESKILGKGREVMGRRKDGSVFPVLLTLGESIEGEEHMFVGILHDMTAYNDAQRKIVAQAVEIQRSHDELDRIGQMASASLQSPLRQMAALDEVIDAQGGSQLDDLTRERLRSLAEQARNASQFVRGLVDYIRAGVRNDAERVDLAALMVDLHSELAQRLAAVGASLEIRCEGETSLNREQARQLFRHLIDNALKFADPARPARIEIACEPGAGRHLTVSVSDNGIGIPKDALELIFEAFYRVDPDHPQAGTGLGLSFCRKIVQAVGGRIAVTSAPGEGSTFTLELPRAA